MFVGLLVRSVGFLYFPTNFSYYVADIEGVGTREG